MTTEVCNICVWCKAQHIVHTLLLQTLVILANLTPTLLDTSIVVFGGTMVFKVAIVSHNVLQSTIKESNNLTQHCEG